MYARYPMDSEELSARQEFSKFKGRKASSELWKGMYILLWLVCGLCAVWRNVRDGNPRAVIELLTESELPNKQKRQV